MPGSCHRLDVPRLSQGRGAAVADPKRHHPVSLGMVSGDRRRRLACAFLRPAPPAWDLPANPVLPDADPLPPGESGAISALAPDGGMEPHHGSARNVSPAHPLRGVAAPGP